METKFNLCDRVSYFNDSEQRIESGVVKGIQVVPVDVHADENGEDVLDKSVVIYALKNGISIVEQAAFGSEEECKKHYIDLFAQ
jgi:hypothetical protein